MSEMNNIEKVILDFDNTIAMSAETIIKLRNPLLKPEQYIEPSTLQWNFEPYAASEDEKREYVDTFNSFTFWHNLVPFPGVIDWLKKQHATGIPIYICSKRFNGQFTNLIEWCRRWGIDEYISDYILINKHFETKKYLLNANTVIIDDNPKCFGNNQEALKVWFNNYGYAKNNVEAGYIYSIQRLSWSDMEVFTGTLLRPVK